MAARGFLLLFCMSVSGGLASAQPQTLAMPVVGGDPEAIGCGLHIFLDGFEEILPAARYEEGFGQLVTFDAPVFISAESAAFRVGDDGSFIVAASGNPCPTLALTDGVLPPKLAFDANSGALAGTPSTSTGGAYLLEFTASNSLGSAVQAFTLTVNEAPEIISVDNVVFTVGSFGGFAVIADGFPAPTFAIDGDALPAGVDFAGATGALSGNPEPGTGGSYALGFTASNELGSSARQAFTLAVQQAPAIVSADEATFAIHVADSFLVSATGFPGGSAIALGMTGSLPAGVSFTDNGDGTATIEGTPGQSGEFPIGISADNGVAPGANQAFTLIVNQAPEITSADAVTFTIGAAGSFTVASAGFPVPTLSTSTPLPPDISLIDNGDGTATLAGTPEASTIEDSPYLLSLTASNGVGSDALQHFTLGIRRAASCLELKSADASLTDGEYEIDRDGDGPMPAITVYCDMSTDGGGYTFLKIDAGGQTFAAAAEATCANFGMQLHIPRSEAHKNSSWLVANDGNIGPGASPDYMRILGIYPDFNGATCSNQPLNSGNSNCGWSASDGLAFFVHASSAFDEPNGDNNVVGSMQYEWDGNGELVGLNDIPGLGYSSAYFICQVGDKQP